jgi:hypothetical protein
MNELRFQRLENFYVLINIEMMLRVGWKMWVKSLATHVLRELAEF